MIYLITIIILLAITTTIGRFFSVALSAISLMLLSIVVSSGAIGLLIAIILRLSV